MARRSDTPAPGGIQGGRQALRYVAFGLGSVAVLMLLAATASRADQFLVADQRVLLPGPPEPGTSSTYFRVEGTFHTAEQQVEQVFAHDFGRSIYLCPIAERRRELRGIDWVKDASVLRVWPNRIIIRITERTPVAFVQIAGVNRTMRTAYIDSEGVLLNPQRAVKLNLPVLTGILPAEKREAREEKVKRMLRLQQELGPLMEKVSEIDASDVDNLKITESLENRAIVLMVGNQKYSQRLQNFLNNAQQIKQRMPDATVLDLRLPDRITAVGGTARVE
jgi:cell division protein FtsQ